MKAGFKMMGYEFGESVLEREEVLSIKDISEENQARVWPAEEGYPFIPKFSSIDEIREKLSKTLKVVLGGLDPSLKQHFVFSFNGAGPESIQYEDVSDVIRDHCSDYSVIDGSCSGSVTSIPIFSGLFEKGYDSVSYIAISDRARMFSDETPLFSINYGDVIAYYVISQKDFKYRIGNIKEFNDTKVMDAKEGDKFARSTIVANKKIYNYEKKAFELIANDIGLKEDGHVVLPRLSPENREYVTSLFGGRGQIKHGTWPISMFSGSNWIVDFSDVFNESETLECVVILAIGVGFCWTAMELKCE